MSSYQLSHIFIKPLLEWYQQNATPLPWRSSKAPYAIWLSEIMLQQTRIETVLPYYKQFLESYPTIYELAAASIDDILKLWEGLGYYSRARNLHQTARIIATQYNGQFPRSTTELKKLPGIGAYTAGAIASIAFGQTAPVLDGNVIRVFARMLNLEDDVTQSTTKKMLWKLAETLVPQEQAGDYNQALMELGQKICTPRNPNCEQCPVQRYCKAQEQQTQTLRPVKKKRAPIPHYDVAAGIIHNQQGKLLIAQRPMEGLLGGLWEFPGGKQEPEESLEDCLIRELKEELAIEVSVGDLFVRVQHRFTHFQITLHAFECAYIGAVAPYTQPQAIEAANWAWVNEDQLDQYSFGKADREVIRALRQRPMLLL